jgi:hypothetical protein
MRKSGRERGAYVSEFTRFIDGYLDLHPEVVADQRLGRSLYWDKRVDLTAIAEAAEDSVPVDAYYYFGDPTRH